MIFEPGARVTWTKAAVERRYSDPMDAALVVEDEVLTIMGKTDPTYGVVVQKKDGTSFPVNVNSLQLVGAQEK